VTVTGNALVDGTIRARRRHHRRVGRERRDPARPDIEAMDYPNTADVKVPSCSWVRASEQTLGGKAYQVPEANPAHIFRKNPNDRRATSTRRSRTTTS
jgi:hypothetical protein